MPVDLRSLYVSINEISEIPRLFFLEIKDQFFREDCALKYHEKWKSAFPGSSFSSCSAAQLLTKKGELFGGSLFATKSLWTLTELSLRGKKNEEFLALLKSVSSGDPADHYFFIVSEDAPSKGFLELLKEQGKYLALEPIKPWERAPFLENWVAQYVKKQGKKITREAIAALTQAYAQDRNSLALELDKLLILATQQDEISLKDVESLCSLEVKTSSWNLLEAILSQDVKGIVHALTYLDEWNDIALLRFVRGQLEKFLFAESAASFRTKTQMKQYEQAQRLGIPCMVRWVKALEMHEVAIKSGEAKISFQDLLLLFLSFTQKV